MNQLDVAIQSVTPTVMVPKFEPFQSLDNNGYRYLMAADGLWVEAKNLWGHVIMPVRIINEINFPYGNIKSKLELNTFNKLLPVDLIRLFVIEARKTPEKEVAAWVVFNAQYKTTTLKMLESNYADADGIGYLCPELSDDESVILDIHSHGSKHGAFFSDDDDEDDKGAFRIAAVVGNVGAPNETVITRLCVYGMFYDLPPLPVLFDQSNAGEGVA